MLLAGCAIYNYNYHYFYMQIGLRVNGYIGKVWRQCILCTRCGLIGLWEINNEFPNIRDKLIDL